ncbi:hypothetical protein IW140_000995 [Coemansia sp. RSA 1813]|nr:hypothetical protein EV178_003986 [Coemansia sp. RSA 1646]KAJ1773336.1 hypothetical protein LPJ74_000589 [Coemansia sp. RSA 1843]KAJ2091554.1 hypothetical protein IW138_001782 [Coemansia sp. RSA 986]KAJ2212062.1 hypothetical protein EV179_004988 [Coemansia sp. RSA 487]KAJ2572246.1 hypothetical protein IW140_000995 [Coemansia sp. RSA 1813]
MSTNKPELFPLPRAGSQQWRTYWVQRREHGDTQAACPDTISEAEKLFEISDCGMSYAALDNEGDTVFPSCSYLELQKQQNRDWAKSIAQRVPESTKDSDCCEIMDKLSHALSLDPGCAMALGRRAQM